MTVVEILRDIPIVLVAAKVAAEVAERIKVPAVVGEIVAGMLIGPSVLGLVGPTEVLEVLAELGVILLLLQVGLEMDVRDLAAVGRASISVAVVGVVLPMAMGYGVGIAFGHDSNTALFLGAALAATSVGITARVFSDLRALTTVEARTVLGAALGGDVLGLVILTVVVRIVTEGTVSFPTVLSIVGVAVAFLVLTAWLGGRFGPPLFRAVQQRSRSAGTLVALALAFTLLFAELADAAKLAPIIGAFVAGLSLSRSDQRERIERDPTPVGHLFIPVFFLAIGIAVDVTSFVQVEVLEVAGALAVVAVIGKLLAAVGAIGAPGDKPLIGLGMLPRGEVGLTPARCCDSSSSRGSASSRAKVPVRVSSRCSSSIRSGCCWPRSSSTPRDRTRNPSRSPVASSSGSTLARRRNRRSLCSSGTRDSCAPPRAGSKGWTKHRS